MSSTLIGSWFSDINTVITDDGSTNDIFAINLQTATKTGAATTTNLSMKCFFYPHFIFANLLYTALPVYKLSWMYSPVSNSVSAQTQIIGADFTVSFFNLIVNATGGGLGSPAAKIQASINSGAFTEIYYILGRSYFEVWDMGIAF